MTKIFTLTLFISLFVNPLSAQWVQTKGPYGARTTAMTTVGNYVYAANRDYGGTDGRVYRSSDLGQLWQLADGGLQGSYIVQFANIGETIIAAPSNEFAIYRTTNQGDHWDKIIAGIFAPALSVEAINDTFWLGTDGGGVFRSVDLGLTWQAMNGPVLSTAGTVIVYDIEHLTGYIFLATEGGGGPANLYRSGNNGISWERVNTGLPLGTNPHKFTVNGNTLFVSCTGDFAQYTYGLYKSDDNGLTWTECNNGIPVILNGNTGEIWAHNGAVYASVTFPDDAPKIYKSVNNGNSFIPVSAGLHNENQEAFAYTAAGGYIFAGMGWYASVYRSANEGVTWEEARRGLANTGVFSLMEQNSRVYAGTQEGLFYTTDAGEHWTEVQNGLPYGLPVTTMEKNGAALYLGTDQYGVYRSTDNGNSYVQVNDGLNSTFATFIEDLLYYNNTLYAATWDGVYKTTTNGDLWTLASNGLPADFGGSLVSVNSVIEHNGALYAGTVLQGIYKSTNGGDNWTAVNTGLSTYAWTVRDLVAVGNDLYAATDDGLYKSVNNGASWAPTTLTGGSMRKLYYDNGNIYVSQYGATVLTGIAVYRSSNNGSSWELYDDGIFPTARVRAFLQSGGMLYAGTDTRSVWRRAGAVIPVSLTHFSGTATPGGNYLTWNTSIEMDNEGFEIERSTDGARFQSLAFVPSNALNGNSNSVLHYSYTDDKAEAMVNWYRLRQHNRSGNNTLSKTVMIRSSAETVNAGPVYPVPAQDFINVDLWIKKEGVFLLSIYDMAGKKLISRSFTLQQGNNKVNLSVAALETGKYVLKLKSPDGNILSRNFVKQ